MRSVTIYGNELATLFQQYGYLIDCVYMVTKDFGPLLHDSKTYE